MGERQPSLFERTGRRVNNESFRAIGEAYKTEGRVLAYIVHNGPHASIRFITDMVKLDVERFMDGTVSVTRTYPGKDRETVEAKPILNRIHIKPSRLARVLRRNLPSQSPKR